jgi:translation initiation factor 2B subunit (eIF-2B alpha/beta/delta family)
LRPDSIPSDFSSEPILRRLCMRTSRLFVVLLIFGVRSVIAGTSTNCVDDFPKLRSEDMADREAMAALVEQCRLKTIENLESNVRDLVSEGSRDKTVQTSILLLGRLRAVEAVPLLVEHLTFSVFYKQTTPWWDGHPCIQALSDIGFVSLDPLLKQAEQTDDKEYLRCAQLVCMNVLGSEMAEKYIENRIEHTTDSVRRGRLQRLKSTPSPLIQ